MQLAVMADIHGNLPALEAVLEHLQTGAVDGILVAGDLTGGGPQSNEVIHRLRSLHSWAIRGNADRALLRYAASQVPASHHTCQQFALLRWTHRHMDRAALDFLRSLPEQRAVELPGAAAIRLVHGSPRDLSEGLDPDGDPAALALALAQTGEAVLVCAHTHIPWQRQRDGRLILNPGAVSGPLNGQVGAQYARLTWRGDHWQAELFTVPYDVKQVWAACRQSGLLEEGGAWARSFLLCLESGKDVLDAFFNYASGLAVEAGLPDSPVIPDPIWERATATFDWQYYGG
jgi:putative phosphoesterase